MDVDRRNPFTTQTRQPVRPVADDGQACRECRRRKSKCDSTVPVCNVCQRYKRHCLYDKHSRTSLTRKHLTEVEERLERAETILRGLFTDAQVSCMLDHGTRDFLEAPRPSDGPFHGPDALSGTQSGPSPGGPQSAAAQPLAVQSFGQFSSQQSPADPDLLRMRSAPEQYLEGLLPAPESEPPGMAPLPFESAPSADDDFEWDEQEPTWSMSDAEGGNAVIDSTEGDAQKLMDGMATLTVDDSHSGYVGITSGAALLRLIWMGTDEGSEGNVDLRSERRKYLEQLFTRRPSESLAPPPWLRTQPSLTRAVVDTLVDAYFKLYHPTFPILHEATFRAQLSNPVQRPGSCIWPILANIVVALGSFVSSTCSSDTDTTIFRAAKDRLSIAVLEAGNLTLVQIFGLAAHYLQKRNRPNSGYNYGGLALRLAIGLGLHKEFDGWKIDPLKMEIRRRVWWSLCVLDVGATVTYGRPLNWPQVGVETALPLNLHERDLTSASSTLPSEVAEATIYTYIRTQSLYHIMTMRIYNRLICKPFPPVEELMALDDELIGGWLDGLPSYFRDDDFLVLNPDYALGHSISKWRFRNTRIIMYRPFLIRWALQLHAPPPGDFSGAELPATNRCLTAAKESINSIRLFWQSHNHTRLAAWYALYFLFQASLIPVHCLRRNPQHPLAPDWRAQVQTTLDVVDAMTDMNSSSLKCRDVILGLCGSSLHDQHAGQGYGGTFSEFGSADAASTWTTGVDATVGDYNDWCDWLSQTNAGTSAWAPTSVGDWDLGPIL